MAAVRPHARLRSASDPFVDPYPQSTSRQTSSRPPLPPPKSNPAKMAPPPKSAPSSRDNYPDITEAVRDTVTVRHDSRTRMGRSQTEMSAPLNSTSRHGPSASRRSHSQDDVLAAAAALEKGKAGKNRNKKGSQHADVIDRLDFTGVGPIFHHDSPFDACAPSRNRHRTKAPMLAWSSRADEVPMQYNDNPYPSADAYKAFSNPTSYEQPKKKVDAIAEAWGIHEPEPFEEFFAGGGTSRQDGDTPASSIYNGNTKRNYGRDPREVYKEYLDEGLHPQAQPQSASRPRANVRRSVVPPPQPIFVPDAETDLVEAPMSSPGSPGAPKRTRSIMRRIRRMRDTPNVPVGADNAEPPEPPSPSSAENGQPQSTNTARPTHRSHNSFLGRFGGISRNTQQVSPTAESPESYVYIEDSKSKSRGAQEKDLPATPSTDTPVENVPGIGYFDGANNGATTSPALGRRTSLMKKVRGVVKGTK